MPRFFTNEQSSSVGNLISKALEYLFEKPLSYELYLSVGNTHFRRIFADNISFEDRKAARAEALNCYNKALELEPKNCDVLLCLAQLHRFGYRERSISGYPPPDIVDEAFDKAIRGYLKIIEIDPNYEPVYEALASKSCSLSFSFFKHYSSPQSEFKNIILSDMKVTRLFYRKLCFFLHELERISQKKEMKHAGESIKKKSLPMLKQIAEELKLMLTEDRNELCDLIFKVKQMPADIKKQIAQELIKTDEQERRAQTSKANNKHIVLSKENLRKCYIYLKKKLPDYLKDTPIPQKITKEDLKESMKLFEQLLKRNIRLEGLTLTPLTPGLDIEKIEEDATKSWKPPKLPSAR